MLQGYNPNSENTDYGNGPRGLNAGHLGTGVVNPTRDLRKTNQHRLNITARWREIRREKSVALERH